MIWTTRLLNLIIIIILFSVASGARVENPIIFIGEVVKGGVNGAPLITDVNGKVAQGILNGMVSVDGNVNCTTTDQVVTGVTITAPPAGTYEISMSGDVSSPTGGLVTTIHFETNGSATAHGTLKFQVFAGGTLTSGSQRMPFAKTMIVTLNGSNALEMWCSGSSGTTTVANSVLTYKRLL